MAPIVSPGCAYGVSAIAQQKIPKYTLPSNSLLKTYILPHKITNELWQFMDNFAIYAAGFAVIHAVKENMEFYA
jgi:hypothetical protein